MKALPCAVAASIALMSPAPAELSVPPETLGVLRLTV
jgi:hypothetical protein